MDRVIKIHLIVAPRNDHHSRSVIDSSTDVLEQVERCFIGPVHIFENHGYRMGPARQIIYDGREQFMPRNRGTKTFSCV